ncbi:uncharacterized protein [Temnothorax nylanderi]|uniref:uncharacterized protein n=1 Tax=Temnothorax nylanderi TaxID=102681 RepID=UPI003A8A4B3C
MWYKGVQANIRQKLSDAYIMDKGEIVMDVNIDGLNLYDSTDGEFWPILGSFSDEADPFIIGVYYGNKKPEDINVFLEDFVTETSVVTSKSSTVQLVKAELLQEVSSKIDILLINQERILRKLFPGEQAVVRPKNLLQLPLQTHEAFNSFQKFLQNDINFNATVDYFASFSRADTEKSAVGKLLPKIISNKLARILKEPHLPRKFFFCIFLYCIF